VSSRLTIYMYSEKLARNTGVGRMVSVDQDDEGLFGYSLGANRDIPHAECEQILLRTYYERTNQEKADIRNYFKQKGFTLT
jgi:hypothetical protein